MTRTLCTLALVAASLCLSASSLPDQAASGTPTPPATWARGVEGQRKADLGTGYFLNPIVAGDHPDPSILKDGDDYYMTFSSFDASPGLVIWHSRDLVNWQPIAPAPRRSRHSGRAPGQSAAN